MIETFLTAYDPSDLPGASIDPLGFERGYLFLADKILPGLTNVASRPRYFAVICAGASLCGAPGDQSPRDLARAREKMVLRFERFCALANVLARPDGSSGIRGVTYAQARAEELRQSGDTRTTGAYRLLSRQRQYGAIGMYASVADDMRLLNRDDFTLTPALGEIVAEAFLEETEIPATLRRAIIDDSDGSDVPLITLASWGERAHVEANVKSREAKCLSDALHYHDLRSRMAGLLRSHPYQNQQQTELERLSRILRSLDSSDKHHDLREAITCILAYESCYQHALLCMERLLWLSRHHAAASVTLTELAEDPVLRQVKAQLPQKVTRLVAALDEATTPGFRENLDRLSDVRRFLESAAGAADEHSAFIDAFIRRHMDVQHGKFDRGRRKMPWLERNDSRICLTMTRAGGANKEITLPSQITPHPYRFGAADALLHASREAPKS
jgi:hypothetical protein